MSFLDRFPKKPSLENFNEELRYFFMSSSRGRRIGNENEFRESIRVGLWLINHLPVTRDAVLEIISLVYQDFVQKYLSLAEKREGDTIALEESADEFLDEIHSTFVLYLENCGEIWSPILSSWTLHLLGQISSANASRQLFSSTRNQSVNEIITIWMGSKAIQSLLKITSKCLTCQNHSTSDSFITALLETSSSHNPHFDWVVAHVGNTYPQTVVTEVLNLGLNTFSTNTLQNSKLGSVAGILGHLANSHGREVQKVFNQMIQNVLSGSNSVAERYAIPYLLQLCSSSVPLLDILMDSLLPNLKEDTFRKLHRTIEGWIQVHFSREGLQALLTHLILKSNRGPTVLQILLEAVKSWGNLAHYASILLNNFKNEIFRMFYESSVAHKELGRNFPCISALCENYSGLIKFLTSSNPELSNFSKEILKLISHYEDESVGVNAILHYLENASSLLDNANFVNLIGSLEIKYPTILSSVLRHLIIQAQLCPYSNSISDRRKDICSEVSKDSVISRSCHSYSSFDDEAECMNQKSRFQPWILLFKLIKGEKAGKSELQFKIQLSEVIKKNLERLVQLLDIRKTSFSIDLATIVIGIIANTRNLTGKSGLNQVSTSSTKATPNPTSNGGTVPAFGTLIKLERYLVNVLFKVLEVSDGVFKKHWKIEQVNYVSILLEELCSNGRNGNETSGTGTLATMSIQNDALRSLVQMSLNPEYRQLFLPTKELFNGGKNDENGNHDKDETDFWGEEYKPKAYSIYNSLLKENQKRSSNISMNLTHSTSFHTGKLNKHKNKKHALLISNRDERRKLKVQIVENENYDLNLKLFLSTLLSVCKGIPNSNGNGTVSTDTKNVGNGTRKEVSIEAMRKVALLLVEIVSPDVMFNGLPWPEEEFSKVQIERDLLIKRAFEEHEYLWDILELVGSYCPSLCYCSVLLRALMATLMSFWISCKKENADKYPKQLNGTIKLINIMKIGQLIPFPLSEIGIILEHLKANEIILLLKDIWLYMKLHVPIPTLFINDPTNPNRFIRDTEFHKVPVSFTEGLRLIIINNISSLGSYYQRFFPNYP